MWLCICCLAGSSDYAGDPCWLQWSEQPEVWQHHYPWDTRSSRVHLCDSCWHHKLYYHIRTQQHPPRWRQEGKHMNVHRHDYVQNKCKIKTTLLFFSYRRKLCSQKKLMYKTHGVIVLAMLTPCYCYSRVSRMYILKRHTFIFISSWASDDQCRGKSKKRFTILL